MSTKSTPSIDVIQFRTFIARCTQQWYGLVGSGMPIDILGYDTTTYRGIIRVATADVSALWSAICNKQNFTSE
ncbi:hypothetical protein BDF22DRAFT_746578 [Syncephalis plumigaleata]|nr:hypothetical protein BDF22DRAFT_746578 [Syncephalis plumigaleata]